MKKMMIMTVAALVVGMAQAAAVAWASGNGAITGVSGESLANSTAYTAYVYFFTDAGGTIPFSAGTGVQISDDTASALASYTGTTQSVFTQAGAPFYAQMVIVSDDGLSTRTSDIRQLGTIPTGNLSLNFGSGAGFIGGTAGGTTWNSAWVTVPEPTSMALLGLGIAAIGLRRKLRK